MKLVSILLFLALIAEQSLCADKPALSATRVATPPKIDGNLDDEAWANSPSVSYTITYLPTFGNSPSERSNIHVVYDNTAVYVGAYLYDSQPGKIAHQLCERDGNAVADDFQLGFDTYNDDLNGYRFMVTAAGVQIDQRITQLNNNERTWDAVWQSEVSIKSDGWVVEIKIPYSAIRFPSKSPQSWGLQFGRNIMRLGELDLWSPVDPKVSGIINQWGTLENLQDIKPPVRLSLSPYFTGGIQITPTSYDPAEYKKEKILGGGADIKWGINEAFTLDATLIPDFGQVQSDNLVLNISPFETKFNEKRPFFTEGTELFNQDNLNNGNNSPQVFYSRRIGGLPFNYFTVYDSPGDDESVLTNPTTSRLYNATKLSGRTNSGLGIGLLNAISKPTYAEIRNDETGVTREFKTNPLTNYNVIVFDQSLHNHSKVSIENTNVWRSGALPDANVTSLHYDLRNKENALQLLGFGNFSSIFDPSVENPITGGYYQVQFNEIKGKWSEWLWHEVITPHYDQNDLGILFFSNQMTNGAGFSYYTQEIKKGIFTSVNFWSNLNYKTQVKPLRYMEWETSNGWNVTLKNFYQFGGNIYAKPVYFYDYYEPRVEGRKYYHYPFAYGNIWMNTDYRKKLNAFVLFGYGDAPGPGNPFFEGEVDLNWIINDHLSLLPAIYASRDKGTESFVDFDTDGNSIFGTRNTSTISDAVTIKYAFNPKMNINLRARYYWSKVNWIAYYVLLEDGTLGTTSFTGNYDINFNVFNIDAVYAWEFAPGSFLNLIWKNNILRSDDLGNDSYLDNWNKTFTTPSANGVSVKVIYYLDYLSLRKKSV